MLIYGIDAQHMETGEQRIALFSTTDLALAWANQFDHNEWDLITFWQELDHPEQISGTIH